MPDQPLRVVLDTNVVLSALIFPGKTTSRIRELWQNGKLIPLISRETTEELLAALQYPKF
ncbi:MAG: putative toxin-antitoxin system toxin component, PIN family, partial [Betaproteobacteria bacterium]|nr:putative toxin-antitoxin system toxin component, PIN family [Betaproteobacteria bacterium]